MAVLAENETFLNALSLVLFCFCHRCLCASQTSTFSWIVFSDHFLWMCDCKCVQLTLGTRLLTVVSLYLFGLLLCTLSTKYDVFTPSWSINGCFEAQVWWPIFPPDENNTTGLHLKLCAPFISPEDSNYRRLLCKTLNAPIYPPLQPTGLPDVALNCTSRSSPHSIVYLLSGEGLWHADWGYLCVAFSSWQNPQRLCRLRSFS